MHRFDENLLKVLVILPCEKCDQIKTKTNPIEKKLDNKCVVYAVYSLQK